MVTQEATVKVVSAETQENKEMSHRLEGNENNAVTELDKGYFSSWAFIIKFQAPLFPIAKHNCRGNLGAGFHGLFPLLSSTT